MEQDSLTRLDYLLFAPEWWRKTEQANRFEA
jgi:hypothetical protein